MRGCYKISILLWFVIVGASGVSATFLVLDHPHFAKQNQDWQGQLALLYGMQNIVHHGQPSHGQWQSDVRFAMAKYEFSYRQGGLGENPYGLVGMRKQLLGENTGDLVFSWGLQVSVPSFSLVANLLNAQVGQDHDHYGWTVSMQAGIAASPQPNQRPAGANYIAALGIGAFWQVFPFASVNLDVTNSPFFTTLHPGMVFRVPQEDLYARFWWNGFIGKIVLPINIIHTSDTLHWHKLSPAIALEYQWNELPFENTRKRIHHDATASSVVSSGQFALVPVPWNSHNKHRSVGKQRVGGQNLILHGEEPFRGLGVIPEFPWLYSFDFVTTYATPTMGVWETLQWSYGMWVNSDNFMPAHFLCVFFRNR
jgi:hypothetical protein